MPEILCYRCFARFLPRQLHFKCLHHKVDDPRLGPGSPLIFPWKGGWRRRPPEYAFCPRDWLQTGFRVCPYCHEDLPYYAGRVKQEIVAVTGCSASGKTVYLWSLLHRLRERFGAESDPPAAVLFEDAAGFRLYQSLARSIVHQRTVPDMTDPTEQKRQGRIPPVTIRLIREGRVRGSVSNLIFYDPSGELIENLDDVGYLRYLAHASSIIYLVECPRKEGRAAADEQSARASDGLGAVVRQIRTELKLPHGRPIPKQLAVAMTMADRLLSPRYGEESVFPGSGQGGAFWRRRGAGAEVERTSERCARLFRDLGYNDLVSSARVNFRSVRFFALSSLGQAPCPDGTLHAAPEPVGVEAPLFWALQGLR